MQQRLDAGIFLPAGHSLHAKLVEYKRVIRQRIDLGLRVATDKGEQLLHERLVFKRAVRKVDSLLCFQYGVEPQIQQKFPEFRPSRAGNAPLEEHRSVRNDLCPAAANRAGDAELFHLLCQKAARAAGIQINKMSRLTQ